MSIFCPVANSIVSSCNNVTVTSTNPLGGSSSSSAPCAWYTEIITPIVNENGTITKGVTRGCAAILMAKTLPLNAMYTVEAILTKDE